jgi:hypothetical protein
VEAKKIVWKNPGARRENQTRTGPIIRREIMEARNDMAPFSIKAVADKSDGGNLSATIFSNTAYFLFPDWLVEGPVAGRNGGGGGGRGEFAAGATFWPPLRL